MVKSNTSYDRPREKIQQMGVSVLSDTELLQALIGSGNGQASVGRIAKRTVRLFKRFGSGVEYEQLRQVSGLGPARVALILAAFEFARRYIMPPNKPIVATDQEVLSQVELYRYKSQPTLVYLLLDGALRLLVRRSIRLSATINMSKILREVVHEQAAHLVVVFVRPDSTTIPSLQDLAILRRLKQSASVLSINIHSTLVVTRDEYTVIRGNP